jgi:hypothetical protein
VTDNNYLAKYSWTCRYSGTTYTNPDHQQVPAVLVHPDFHGAALQHFVEAKDFLRDRHVPDGNLRGQLVWVFQALEAGRQIHDKLREQLEFLKKELEDRDMTIANLKGDADRADFVAEEHRREMRELEERVETAERGMRAYQGEAIARGNLLAEANTRASRLLTVLEQATNMRYAFMSVNGVDTLVVQ